MIHYSCPKGRASVRSGGETHSSQVSACGEEAAGQSKSRWGDRTANTQEGTDSPGDRAEARVQLTLPLRFEKCKSSSLQEKPSLVSADSLSDTLILVSELYSGSLFCPRPFALPEPQPDPALSCAGLPLRAIGGCKSMPSKKRAELQRGGHRGRFASPIWTRETWKLGHRISPPPGSPPLGPE